jgi:hypothetical protein
MYDYLYKYYLYKNIIYIKYKFFVLVLVEFKSKIALEFLFNIKKK